MFLRIWIFSRIAERSLETSSAFSLDSFWSQDQQKRLRPAEAYEMTHMSSIARRHLSDLKDPSMNAFVHCHISSCRSLCYTYQGIGGAHSCNRHFAGSAVWIGKTDLAVWDFWSADRGSSNRTCCIAQQHKHHLWISEYLWQASEDCIFPAFQRCGAVALRLWDPEVLGLLLLHPLGLHGAEMFDVRRSLDLTSRESISEKHKWQNASWNKNHWREETGRKIHGHTAGHSIGPNKAPGRKSELICSFAQLLKLKKDSRQNTANFNMLNPPSIMFNS